MRLYMQGKANEPKRIVFGHDVKIDKQQKPVEAANRS